VFVPGYGGISSSIGTPDIVDTNPLRAVTQSRPENAPELPFMVPQFVPRASLLNYR
jgi:hypothetical protein